MRLFSSILLVYAAFAAFAAQPYSGLSPEDAVKAVKVPDGFHVALVAGEPDVVQPVSFDFDDRGRIWVAEFLSYPKWAPEGHDRIVLLEKGSDGDRLTKRTVVWDKANYVTGLTLGYGGIWVISPPNLWFLPCDFNADAPKISGEPQIVLDGWSHAGVHNIVSNLNWGPDGWLYGCCGITSRSRVGAPGTPESARVYIDGGVWRYHPVTKKLESVCVGTCNPWGLDWDERGEMFITSSVVSHLFHVVPGARFERSHESDQNPYTYELMTGIADHKHYDGASWADIKKPGKHADFGGGHSHVGALIYKGRDWPEKYRDTIFMCNTHGNRINADKLELTKDGYVAHHCDDFMLANDTSFRGVTLKMGPEGAMYVSDWHQDGECHSGSEVGSGRIFKIWYGDKTPTAIDLLKTYDDFSKRFIDSPKQADAEKKLFSGTQWARIHAERSIAEKTEAVPIELPETHFDNSLLKPIVKWGNDEAKAAALIQKLDGIGRLHLCSAIQRAGSMPEDWKKYLCMAMARNPADANSRNNRLMLWYTLEPLLAGDSSWAFKVFREIRIPALRPFIARRMSEYSVPLSVRELSKTTDEDLELDLLRGIAAALKGRYKAETPARWKDWYENSSKSGNAELKALAQQIAAVFGDAVTLDALRKIVEDKKLTVVQRRNALQALLDAHDDKLVPLLQRVVAKDLDMRRDAMRALARFDDPVSAPLILHLYPKLEADERADALATLAARRESARELLAALKEKRVPAADLNAAVVTALNAHGIDEIDSWIQSNWGTSRKTGEDKLKEIARLKKLALETAPTSIDATRGHEVFKKTCMNCHTLFGEGGKVGPDLTGSARGNLDYLLINIVDPNAIVPQEYFAWTVKTKDGRVLAGLIRNERAESLDVITATETITLRRDDIALKRRGELSMMPEGVLSPLKDNEILDLIAFLQSNAK